MPPAYLAAVILVLVTNMVTSGRGIFSREFQLVIVLVTAISLFAAMLACAIIAVIITAWV